MRERVRRERRVDGTPAPVAPAPADAPRGGLRRAVEIEAIQRTAGNRVARRAALGALQRSVDVGAADHPSEVEADRVARDVVATSAHSGETAQRLPEEDELLQAKRDDAVQREEEEDELLQAKADSPEVGREGGQASAETGDAINRAKGGGRALPESARSKMETAFGADFSNVRVHSDSEALALNRNVGAKAFTTGEDIFFGRSGFNPASASGQELLAHELTHVVQQGAARSLDEDTHTEGDGHRQH